MADQDRDLVMRIAADNRNRLVFFLQGKELADAHEFIKQQWLKSTVTGCDGGRFSYEFTPTGLGMCVVIIDNVTKERKNITNSSEW